MSTKAANVYSVRDLRKVTDERLPLVLATLGYTQSHALEDTRLAIGYLIAIVSGVTYFLEKKMTFGDALPYTKILLVLYAVLSGAAWILAKFVEKDIVYRGYKKGSNNKTQVVEIAGTVEKYTPEYNLTITTKPAGSPGVSKQVTLEFKDVFDKFGNMYDAELATWIQSQLGEDSKSK